MITGRNKKKGVYMNDAFFTKIVDKGHYKLQYKAFYEQLNDDFTDDQNEYDDLIKRINNYDLVCFTAKVSVIVNGLEFGSDYLGQCVYETPEEFFNGQDDVYLQAMIKTALSEAREKLDLFTTVNPENLK